MLEKTMKKTKFSCLQSLKKRVESISQRYGCGDPDSDPHQNVTDPQHCLWECLTELKMNFWDELTTLAMFAKKNFKLDDDILKSSWRLKTSSTGGV